MSEPAAAAIPEQASAPRRRVSPVERRLLIGAIAFLLLVFALAIAAPVSRTLEPPEAKSLLFVAAGGEPIARRGATIEAPVRIAELPDHVWQPFVAIEDQRFRRHPGVDPIGLARAMWRNLSAFEMREGGSTITQQLAKQIYLSSDRNLGRKLKELFIAIWLEANLSKDEILERYLSSSYFGNNLYGLRAASLHYFSKDPDELSVGEAALLAGIVKAPSRLAPDENLRDARERAELVLDAMVDQRMLDESEAERLPRIRLDETDERLARGSYFTDWLLSSSPALKETKGQAVVTTTLDSRLQRLAQLAAARAPAGAQVALVAMRPDGRVAAMVGGRNYATSVYNRATQARRQPGSTFKLFVYLTALQEGMSPDDRVLDAPITIDDWSPVNADGTYLGSITLREAFQRSSNVAAVRLAEQVGRGDVIDTARRLGISSELKSHPSLALGTSTTTLMEMTAAFAGIAGNRFPVAPRGTPQSDESWLARVTGSSRSIDDKTLPLMRDLLWSAVNGGTGRAAALATPTFGKTGTSQDNRDAIFIGFAGDLVAGVWIGRDDNQPLGKVSGGTIPAEIWREFMAGALGETVARPPVVLKWNIDPDELAPVVRERSGRGGGKGRGRGKGKGKKKR